MSGNLRAPFPAVAHGVIFSHRVAEKLHAGTVGSATLAGGRDGMDKPAYHFDRWGTYLGRVDEDGRYFDSGGTLCGLIDDGGVLTSTDGKSRGHVDVQGQVWDDRGRYAGFFLPAVRPRALAGMQRAL